VQVHAKLAMEQQTLRSVAIIAIMAYHTKRLQIILTASHVLRTPINAVSLVRVFVKKGLVAPLIPLLLVVLVALHVPQAIIKRPIQMLHVPRAVPIHQLVVVEIPMDRALQAKLEIPDLVQHVVLENTRMLRAPPNVVML
jgi:hypothetical protein